MKNVIFVDDEPNVLSGIKRLLRPMRKEWEMQFFETGADVLTAMSEKPCDVLISDMRMPVMDGVELLSTVKRDFPGTIRIALSGQTESCMIYRCIKHAHQYLAKPCDADQLISAVNSACVIQDMIDDEKLKALVSNLTSIPSLPGAYEKIMEELQSEHSSLQSVGKIIDGDVAMTAKILQVVNSAYFGLPRHVSQASEAATFLGLDVIKNLVLANGVFSQFDDKQVKAIGLNEIWERSAMVGALAGKIAMAETRDKRLADYSTMAGMLGDIGTLVLAGEFPKEMEEARCSLVDSDRREWEIENELLGHNHMHVSGYLVALWGLPNPIVEAVRFHHTPADYQQTEFSALTAVHAANAIVRSNGDEELNELDYDYLEKLNLTANIDVWRSMHNSESDEQDERKYG